MPHRKAHVSSLSNTIHEIKDELVLMKEERDLAT